MKKFSNYQYVPVVPMTDRDKQEQGSKFWNKGKWDNFVLPFLPEDCSELTFTDIGCNAGVFLELAEKKGFNKVIGVDNDRRAIDKALRYRKKIGGTYDLRRLWMERDSTLDGLPVSDYMVMAMTHYYFDINTWFAFLDRLMLKTRNCIIVTAKKRKRVSKASADTDNIRDYFKLWEETGHIPELPLEGDPFPRRQWSFCFKSPLLERVSLDDLVCLNPNLPGFYEEIHSGKDPLRTTYYNKIRRNRRRKWAGRKLAIYVDDKSRYVKDIKKRGILSPLIVNSENEILDGAHRFHALKFLGHKSVIIRRVK